MEMKLILYYYLLPYAILIAIWGSSIVIGYMSLKRQEAKQSNELHPDSISTESSKQDMQIKRNALFLSSSLSILLFFIKIVIVTTIILFIDICFGAISFLIGTQLSQWYPLADNHELSVLSVVFLSIILVIFITFTIILIIKTIRLFSTQIDIIFMSIHFSCTIFHKDRLNIEFFTDDFNLMLKKIHAKHSSGCFFNIFNRILD